MRKWLWPALAAAAVIIGGLVFVRIASQKNTLNVLNWDFYIGRETLSRYQDLHGVRVDYTVYSSNEDARDRIRAAPGQYDVVFPSDYMMDYMIRSGMLEPLPPGALPNVSPSVIDQAAIDEFQTRGWARYCVPYLHGNTGFAVNRNHLDRPARSISWRWLASDEFRGRLLVLDDPRQVLGSVLIELGLDPNSANPEHLNQAVSLLRSLRPKIIEFTSDTGKERMLEGTAAVAFAWSGDSLQVAAERNNWSYSVPQAGGIRFQDGVCIPRGAPHRERALEFLNFVLDPEVHLDILQTTRYLTTNRAARDRAPQRLRENMDTASGVGLKMHQLRDLTDEELRRFEEAWSRVK